MKLPIPDNRRGTPCGCPAGPHRPPAESPLHVAIPGARKDTGPSRRVKHAAGRPSQSAPGRTPVLVWRGVILGALFRALGVLEARRLDVLGLFFGALPHRPRSGEILREKEWGFSYPHSYGGTESPPSYPTNSGPTGAQRKQPWRRGGQECPPSGGAPCFRRSGGFPTPTPTGGLKVPPPIRPTPAPPGPSESNRGEEGDKNVPPPGGHGFLRRREIGPSVRFRAGGGVRKNTGGERRCGRPVFLECEVVRRRQG